MNPIYYATMALTALSLSAGDAEAVNRFILEKKQKLEPLLVHYKTSCLDKRGKKNTAYCLELGADIFEQGTELSAPDSQPEVENGKG